MKADLIRIGNSKGVRIPKAVLDQYGFGQRVEMRIEAGSLIISPVKAARVAGTRRVQSHGGAGGRCGSASRQSRAQL